MIVSIVSELSTDDTDDGIGLLDADGPTCTKELLLLTAQCGHPTSLSYATVRPVELAIRRDCMFSPALNAVGNYRNIALQV